METFTNFVKSLDERSNRVSRRKVVNEFLQDEIKIKKTVDRISNTNVRYLMKRLFDLIYVLLIDFRKKGKI